MSNFFLQDDGTSKFLQDIGTEPEALVLEEDGITEIELEEGTGSIEADVASVGYLLVDSGPWNLSLEDSVVVSDQLARVHDATRTPADQVALTDSLLPGFTLELELDDTVALTDNAGIGQGKALADDVGLADSLSRVHDAVRTQADSVTARDGLIELQNTDGTDHELLLEGDPVGLSDAVALEHGTPRRLSQLPVEVLVQGDSDGRLSQLPVEVLVQGSGPARLSQLPVEVLWQGESSGRLSQLPVEVLRRVSYENVTITIID